MKKNNKYNLCSNQLLNEYTEYDNTVYFGTEYGKIVDY